MTDPTDQQPGNPDDLTVVVGAILAVQRGLERKTTVLVWTLRMLGVVMVAVLIVAGMALVQANDNHRLAERTGQTLNIVRSATDPNGSIAQRGARNTNIVVDSIIHCIDNHIDVTVLHGTPDPGCPK